MLFPTGFAANLALPYALARTNTAIFSDELNHASVVDGIRMAVRGSSAAAGGSASVLHVYKHNDVVDLESKMQAEAACGMLVGGKHVGVKCLCV